VPIVDAHLHVWSEERERYPRADTPYRGNVELLLDYMADAGVAQAVIVLSMHYRYDNRLLVDLLREHPGLFAGTGVIDPRGPAAVDSLDELHAAGVRSIRLRPTFADEEPWFGHADTLPLWRRAAELGTVLCLQGRPQHARPFREMVERFPEVRCVLDHFVSTPAAEGVGGEAFREVLAMAAAPNVHLKLSGLHYWGGGRYPWPLAQPMLRAAFDAYGPRRIMWGSDWPHVLFGGGYTRLLNFVRRDMTWLSEAERERVLGLNARELFHFPGV
jgi:L-fuconolactonase